MTLGCYPVACQQCAKTKMCKNYMDLFRTIKCGIHRPHRKSSAIFKMSGFGFGFVARFMGCGFISMSARPLNKNSQRRCWHTVVTTFKSNGTIFFFFFFASHRNAKTFFNLKIHFNQRITSKMLHTLQL